MPASTAENLIAVFRSAARLSLNGAKSSSAVANKKLSSSSAASAAEDAALKKFVSGINPSSEAGPESCKSLVKSFKSPEPRKSCSVSLSSLFDVVKDSSKVHSQNAEDHSGKQLATEASSLLYNGLDLDWDDLSEDDQPLADILIFPWMSRLSCDNISFRRKVVSHQKKNKWVFKNTQTTRIGKLVKMCAAKLGPDATLDIFGRLGCETGLKEYNALIKVCIDEARVSTDEEVALEQIYKAYQIFKLVKEAGFIIEEETYGQFLMYLIDFGMVDEFFFFREIIQDKNPDTLSRLAYYEMLLWIRVNNKVKIHELCSSVMSNDAENNASLRENLLLALGEGLRKEEFLMLLNSFDLKKVKCDNFLISIFKSLGKLSLESLAAKFLLDLTSCDISAEKISMFICEYVLNIPNLAVEDIVEKFHTLHTKLEVLPTSAQYEKLIIYLCGLFEVHEALSIAEEACKSCLNLSTETIHALLDACDRSCEYTLVQDIHSMICCHNLKPNGETFRMMIQLCVKMKDFEGAHRMINDLQTMKLAPTSSMFNAIMHGYFREKNTAGAMNVLKLMEDASVKPDAATFACMISHSHHEKSIIKNYNDMINSGVPPTKQVYMALVNAYAACGKFDEAKQIILDKRISAKNLTEIKNVLLGALSFHGQVSDALKLYEDLKYNCSLEPKAIGSLIEHFQANGELDKLFQLLEEINGSPYWVDACYRVISYCVQHDHLRLTVDLLKRMIDKFNNCEVATEVLFDEVFYFVVEKEAKDMHFAINLLQALKNELGVRPSRKVLDFLLCACVNAKDSKILFTVWEEYKSADLPYNVLSFVRMYQALLALGDQAAAAKILNKISKDDPHVRCVIQACQKTYTKPSSESKKKKKNWELAAALSLMEGLGTKNQKR